jgi:L-cysteate sulfo-lyase
MFMIPMPPTISDIDATAASRSAMIRLLLLHRGRWRKDEDVVFLHTGGAPALFAYQSALGI